MLANSLLFLKTVSTLHKQNFDLKLELFHRRQRQEALESDLENARKQIHDRAEMLEVNEELLRELEKRDQAVEQAVSLICDLEAKIERLELERQAVRNHGSQYKEGSYHEDYENEMPSSPPTYDRDTTSTTPKGRSRSMVIARMPSFLSEQSEGVEALRSLYLPSNTSYSDVTLPKLPEEGSENGMPSPSMSVLSESSFMSIYGAKPPAANEDFDSPPPRQHRRTSSSVEKWIDERPASIMPIRMPSPSSQYSGRRSQFLSMNYVAASPLQRLEKLRTNLEKQYNNSTNLRLKTRSDKRDSFHDRQLAKEDNHRLTTDGNGFETSQKLPPTPDTISTGTLRNYKNSDDTLNQRQQANEDEVTFFQNTSTFSVPPATYNPYQSTASVVRPRSAGETVTSRREGHGWDTETMDTDELDTFTNSSTESTKVHRPTRQPRGGKQTPEFFSFNTTSSERDNLRNWGVDGTVSNYPTTRVPSGFNSGSRRSSNVAQRCEMPRAVSQTETHARSDDTITPGYLDRRPQSRVEDHRERERNREIERSSTPIDDKISKPLAPDRRSSLAAATSKLRKHAPASINASHDSHIKIPLAPVSASIPNTPSRETPKEKEGGKEKDFRRLLPTRLFFGRSETAPANHVTSKSTSSSSSSSNIDQRTKYQSLPTRNRYSSRRTDLSNYQMDGSDNNRNRASNKTYYEEDEVGVDEGRSATPPPIARNRAQSAQTQREYGRRPRSAAGVRERDRRGFGADGAHDGGELVRNVEGGGGERKDARGSSMGMRRSENMPVDAGQENHRENDAAKDKENSSSSTPGRKWFGLAHVGVGRSSSVSKR